MNDKPVREIQPVVVPAQYYVWGPLVSAFAAIFPGFFVFVISNMIIRQFEPVVSYGLVVFVLAFIGFMVLAAIKVFREPSHTVYTIYPDRLEYSEGLWNRHRRTLVFDQVIDVQLTEGLLQQTQGAGTITLVTQQLVSHGEGKLSNRRISLSNVPQPQEVYELLRNLALKPGRA